MTGYSITEVIMLVMVSKGWWDYVWIFVACVVTLNQLFFMSRLSFRFGSLDSVGFGKSAKWCSSRQTLHGWRFIESRNEFWYFPDRERATAVRSASKRLAPWHWELETNVRSCILGPFFVDTFIRQLSLIMMIHWESWHSLSLLKNQPLTTLLPFKVELDVALLH